MVHKVTTGLLSWRSLDIQFVLCCGFRKFSLSQEMGPYTQKSSWTAVVRCRMFRWQWTTYWKEVAVAEFKVPSGHLRDLSDEKLPKEWWQFVLSLPFELCLSRTQVIIFADWANILSSFVWKVFLADLTVGRNQSLYIAWTSTLFRQRANTVTVGWFMGGTCKVPIMWYTKLT